MRALMSRRTGPAVTSAVAVLAVSAIIMLSYDLGPQARHMWLHIASMNIVAPLLAAFVVVRRPAPVSPVSGLWTATFIQIASLWAWHAPATHDALMSLPALQFAMHGMLLLAAVWFWSALLTLSSLRRWQAIPALLITGKLVCLLAALLVFAPRALYGAAGHLTHAAEQSPAPHALGDQQLAGLLMIAACPLSYLVAAVLIAIQLVSPQNVPDAMPWRRSPQTAG